jgi:multiple sugar transport system substrate-binding protein
MAHQVRRMTVLMAALAMGTLFPGGPAAAQDPVTLNLWVFEGEEGFLPQVKESFEASHPDIKLEITTLPEDQYGTKLDTALAAGSPPDIAFVYDPRYIKAGHMVPIGDALTARGVDLTRFAPGPIAPCTYEGKLYCIGTYTGALVLMYNKDMFDAAGIPYPSSTVPMTVDEYAALVQRLAVASDDPAQRVYGGEAGATYWWTEPTDFIGPDGRTVVGVLDDDATIHDWDVTTGLVRDGYAMTDALGASMGIESLLASGGAAMGFEDNTQIGPLLAQGLNVGIAPLPVETSGQPAFVPSWTDAWSTFTTSQHPEQALDLLTFMATEGNQLRLAGGMFPLDQQLAKDSDYAAGNPARQQMLDVMGLTRTIPFVPGWFSVFGQLEDTFTQVIDNGDAAAALHDIAPILQDDLAREWETWDAVQ